MGSLSIRRLGYALGAEVTGIDFTKPVDDETIAEVRSAWLEHLLLCFPGHAWEPHEMLAFCRRFGQVDDNRPGNAVVQHPELPEVLMLQNAPGQLKADYWHSDRSYTDRPATATFLTAKQLPEVGGETQFANLQAAYHDLSPAFKELLGSLVGVYDYKLHPQYALRPPDMQVKVLKLFPSVVHPLVRIHDETGKKSLCIDRLLRNFQGMTQEETKPVLDFLFEHSTRYEFLYRHRWSVNDLIMWDNRATLHYAVADFDPNQTRRMQRISLVGPKTGKPAEPELVGAAG